MDIIKVEFELIKDGKGYFLSEIPKEQSINISELNDLGSQGEFENEMSFMTNNAFMASTDGSTKYKLNRSDCDSIFGVKSRRKFTPKNIERCGKCQKCFIGFECKEVGSYRERRLMDISESMRLEMYNFLSGRGVTHTEYITIYNKFEAELHDLGVVRSNHYNMDERMDDEYFNDYLEDERYIKKFTNKDVKTVWEWTQRYVHKDVNTLHELLPKLGTPSKLIVDVECEMIDGKVTPLANDDYEIVVNKFFEF